MKSLGVVGLYRAVIADGVQDSRPSVSVQVTIIVATEPESRR